MRTTFFMAWVFPLVAATGNINVIDLGRRQGSPLSASSSTTSASANPSTISSPGPVQQALVFTTPANVTTCESADILWSYTGPAEDLLTLVINNVDVNQTNVDPPPPIISIDIADDIDPSSENYTWTPVNLPGGYYVVSGSIAGGSSNVESNVFLISNGSDTSCLATSTTPTTSSSLSATSTSATSTIATSSTPSNTLVPVSSSKKSNTGAIAGGVVAGIVALLVLVFIGMMLMRRRNKSARARRFSNSGDTFSRTQPTNTPRHHGPSESTGGMLSDIGPAITTAVDAQSHEDLYSVVEKDMAGSPEKHSIGAIAQLSYAAGNPHRSSSSSSLNHQPITARTSFSHSRASPPNGRRPSLDIVDYAHSERSLSGATRPFSPRATGSAAELVPMGRSSSGQSRRASRKPVPQYDASELQATPSEQSLPMPSQTGAVSGLRHQNSSGDVRPVHYLIPDLPPSSEY